MTARDWIVLVPVTLVAGVLGFGVLGIVEPSIRDTLFGWLPSWFLNPLPTDDIGQFTSAAWTTTLGAYLILNAFADQSSRSSISAAICCRAWASSAAGRHW